MPIRSTSAVLRILIAVIGAVFVAASILSGEWLNALALFSFFGLAFSSLSCTGIDPDVNDPESKNWFLVALAFGAAAALLLLVFLGTAIVEGNSKDALRLAAPLPMLIFVWWQNRVSLLAAIKRSLDTNDKSNPDAPDAGD